MAVPLDQFIRRVSESSVMSKEDIAVMLAALPLERQPTDGETLAKLLVKEKKLTKYQAEQIYAGKGKSLLLGNYLISDKIGAGGMGQVFKARHKRMDRLVAIKLLPPEVNKDEAAIQRFHREVKAAAKLTHPNIVIAYDADEAPGGIHFLVMEYVEGRDLAQVANSTTHLPVDSVLNYIVQAARGLAFAHENGVVHRDIKPANLLLDAKGTVKILDMGLARIHDAAVQAAKDGLTKSGDVMGTVDYMAPEQAFDTHKADGRADIYSLGCTMYRLLTKANLYEAESLVQKLMAHQSKPIPSLRQQRPDVSAELEAAFQRMVAKSAEDRFQTMGEVNAALEPLLGASSSSTPVKKEPDSKIKAFFRGLTGGSTKPGNDAPTSALGERVAVVAPASTEPAQTIALSSPLQVTDPVSDRSIAAARTIVPKRNQKKPAGPWWRNRNLLIASGAGGFLLVLLAIWVIIKDKDGKEIARLKVPEGGSSKTKEVPKLPQEKSPTIQQTLGDPADTTAVATVDNGSRWPFDPNDGQEYTWSKPENLGSGVNTAEDETLAGISQDGLKLYFLRGGQGYFAVRNNLTEAFRDAREFPQVQNVQGFSVSATGRAMVIASTTGVANIDKISLSLRPDHLSPLGPFELAPPPVNGKDWMIHPVLSGDGATLLACTDRNDGQWADIWMFTRTKLEAPFTTSERLPAPVNTPDWDIPFLISNDRCFVITGSQRQKTDGEPLAKKKPFVRTIRYFTRSNPTEPFGPGHPLSIHLGKLDTSDTNGGFKLGGDRRTLYFESGYRPDSAGGIDLWMSRRVPVAPGARPSS
jgi:serine/threonine protein kinase